MFLTLPGGACERRGVSVHVPTWLHTQVWRLNREAPFPSKIPHLQLVFFSRKEWTILPRQQSLRIFGQYFYNELKATLRDLFFEIMYVHSKGKKQIYSIFRHRLGKKQVIPHPKSADIFHTTEWNVLSETLSHSYTLRCKLHCSRDVYFINSQ